MNIGILGGGQLGMMLAQAAEKLGHTCIIYCPEENSPASRIYNVVTGDYNDLNKLKQFSKKIEVIGLEFENIPVESLEFLATLKPVYPNANCLKISQDRLLEKQFLKSLSIKTAPFLPVATEVALGHCLGLLGEGILKTRRFGYDGKGQVRLGISDNIIKAWQDIGAQPAILEGLVNFTDEISVIVARDQQGNTKFWHPAKNIHENGILRQSIVPCGLSQTVIDEAQSIALKIAESLEVIGLLAVELFVEANGSIRVNEIAPRPHNSGHWTMNGSKTSQFEQYIRCLTGMPLGDTALTCDRINMYNVLGQDKAILPDWEDNPQASIHLYGKNDWRNNRKMGHINVID